MTAKEKLIRPHVKAFCETAKPRDFQMLMGLIQDYLDSAQRPMDDGLLHSCAIHAVAAPTCGEDPIRVEMVHEIIARLGMAPIGMLASILKRLPPIGTEH
jgi:hypothetical protein